MPPLTKENLKRKLPNVSGVRLIITSTMSVGEQTDVVNQLMLAGRLHRGINAIEQRKKVTWEQIALAQS